MPLPANPSDGQTALLNGISYVYDDAKGTWRRQATSITVSDFVVQGNLTLASNVESTSSSTGALVISGGLGVSGSVYSGGIYTNSLFYSNGSPYTVSGSGGASASSVPKITNLQVTDSSYVVLDDTAVDIAGGYIKITGTDFVSGCTVLIGSTPASSVTYISSTEVRAQVPATSAGTYVVYLVNPDGGVAIRVNGITFSGVPSWVTDGTLGTVAVDQAISIQLDATGASTYSLASGSILPTGLTLSNVGLLSGTVTGLTNNTTYNFTVVATDTENQDSNRNFSITILFVENISLSGGTETSTVYTAPNGVVVTSSEGIYVNSNFYKLSYLFDGVSNSTSGTTYWLSAAQKTGTLTFNFNNTSLVNIYSIEIFPRTRSDSFTSVTNIQISNDGSSWQIVEGTSLAVNSNTPYGFSQTFVLNTSYKYIRLNLSVSGSWGMSLSEVKFTGS